jgi:hypothetical protein
VPVSRREWLLDFFSKACEHLKRNQNYKVWQDGYHAEIAHSNKFLKEKIIYIHNNPVKDKIVEFPKDYIFSSARNYASLDNELEIAIPMVQLTTKPSTDYKSALSSNNENLHIYC